MTTITLSPLLLALLLAPPAAEVSTLDGRTLAGSLTALGGGMATVDAAGGPTVVPLDQVLEIRLPGSDALPTVAPPLTIWLADGSRIDAAEVTSADRVVTVNSPVAGVFTLPQKAVRAVRFKPSDAAVDAKWSELLADPPAKDLLVVRNGDVLDRLEGTAGTLDAGTLNFLVGQQAVAIPRDKPKLYGVVFAKPPAAPPAPPVVVRLRGGNRMGATSVSLAGDAFQLTLPSGGAATAPVSAVESLDYGRGKVAFLSDLEPRVRQHTPFFGDFSVFEVRTDRNDDGGPIRIDGQTFRRGLVIHSKTTLTWRLAGDYRRFVAVAGIEDIVRHVRDGADVRLTITADGRSLFDAPVTGRDPAIPLDLDVSGVRDLTVTVDYGGKLDIADHLALGDVRVIK